MVPIVSTLIERINRKAHDFLKHFSVIFTVFVAFFYETKSEYTKVVTTYYFRIHSSPLFTE